MILGLLRTPVSHSSITRNQDGKDVVNNASLRALHLYFAEYCLLKVELAIKVTGLQLQTK
jgi:hypothetical protein